MLNKIDTRLQFYRSLTDDTVNKINNLKSIVIDSKKMVEVIIISGDNVDNIAQIVDNLGGKYENLGYGYGIVTLPVDNLSKLELYKTIQYIELPKELYISDSESNRAACILNAQSSYNVDGSGVIIGFIDTGIDYMHPGFRSEDGSTRIEYIYDLSLDGKVYDKNTINEAIKSSNPSSIVPSTDLLEHGTHVAGIACAGGNIPKYNYGVAPNSSIIMVKANRGRFALSTQILRGLKFLVDKSKELNMPLVVNISLSTNDGAHNGNSLLEKYISTVCDLERITVVIAAGNEGDASHHVGDELREEQTIDINISEDETYIELALYKDILPNIRVQIINPTGKMSQEIEVKSGLNEVFLDGDKIILYSSGPKPFDLLGEIIIGFIPGGEYLVSGIWRFKIKVVNNYNGIYNIWLPVREGLNKNTKFLRPTLFNTLGIPATVSNVISVGSYNYLTNTISPFSGRGIAVNKCFMKPDIIAPGEGIISTVPFGEFDSKSGTSMATPHIAGIAALFMQWGIVKNNDKFLFGERLKNYLVRGARRDRPSIEYPNPLWGYGTVCAYDSFEILRNELKLPINNMRSENRQIKDNRVVIEYTGDIEKALSKYKDIDINILDETFAVINIRDGNLEKIMNDNPEIVFSESQSIYTLNDISPVEASGAPMFHKNPYLTLNGRGVIVGIIDTGIDYMNKEFMREDDTTRIFSLWDQTIVENINQSENSFGYGKVFTEEDINKAINTSKSGGDPYSVVNSVDTIGHGTMVAGVVGARGRNPGLVGVAPDCDFIVVKLKEASEEYLENLGVTSKGEGRYENVDVLLGIKFILNEAKRKNVPFVIYIPLGTNIGAHDGSSVVERFIGDISKRRGLAVVTCTGNEGNTDTHTLGRIEKTGDINNIELNVDRRQNDLFLEIWVNKPDKVSLSIVSPSGEVIEKIPSKIKQVQEIKFVFEGTTMFIEYRIPEETTGDELIKIRMKDLKEGIWQFKLIGDYIVNGEYNAWIPQRSLIEEDTKFLNSNQYTTLTIPATSQMAIVSAHYNQNNNATVGSSGRGYTRDGRQKPDIACGGINATVLAPGGGTKLASGSSIGGAVLAGCCALLLQWGIVDNNDPTMYSVKMKTYIIRGAEKRSGDVYPNRQWGYGMISIRGIFDNIRSRGYDEFYLGDMFVRRPNK